jgi:hypothetical protein
LDQGDQGVVRALETSGFHLSLVWSPRLLGLLQTPKQCRELALQLMQQQLRVDEQKLLSLRSPFHGDANGITVG